MGTLMGLDHSNLNQMHQDRFNFCETLIMRDFNLKPCEKMTYHHVIALYSMELRGHMVEPETKTSTRNKKMCR